ncbi:MAG: hypothetical protein DRJ05_18100 [Bacteroidetes bacterium]|nr:MAG: hypothetical protein DRJ05_18100 [Bacteroidota bacterium]
MKKIFLATLTIVIVSGFISLINAQNPFFTDVDNFMKTYVVDGKVKYALIVENPTKLSIIRKEISEFPLTDEIGPRNKAFYINAYNVLVIAQIVDNYPIGSPMEIPGFFDANKFDVAGDKLTLNQIENEILRPVYNDPRFHFVLVCGAVSCPPITNFAYMPDQLDSQMDKQAKLALNDSNFIRYDGETLSLSEIFKWYKDDFLIEHTTLVQYVNSYRNKPIAEDVKTSYYDYDWTLNEIIVESKPVMQENSNVAKTSPVVSNIFAYTPSSLLKKGGIEMQLFNNIYTQTAYRNADREEIKQEGRSTYYGGSFYALYGVSKAARVNVGFDLNVKAVYIDSVNGSPFKVFKFETTPYSRTALTSIGPKIKFQPIKSVSNFSVQSAFWIPIADDLESIEEFHDYPWMDYHMYTWWNQFYFDKTFGSNWQIFTEFDFLFRFKKTGSNTPTHVDLPLSLFASWFPTSKSTLYFQIQYSPRLQLEETQEYDWATESNYTVDPFELISDYAQTGLGAKYQLTRNFNLELSGTYFFTSKNGGAGYTMNLGLRYII